MAIGKKTGGGSRKGKPNKLPAAIRTMIEQALTEVGGVEYLKTQAEKNPVAFLAVACQGAPLGDGWGFPFAPREHPHRSARFDDTRKVTSRDNLAPLRRGIFLCGVTSETRRRRQSGAIRRQPLAPADPQIAQSHWPGHEADPPGGYRIAAESPLCREGFQRRLENASL
jgi:hypothetical protein